MPAFLALSFRIAINHSETTESELVDPYYDNLWWLYYELATRYYVRYE